MTLFKQTCALCGRSARDLVPSYGPFGRHWVCDSEDEYVYAACGSESRRLHAEREAAATRRAAIFAGTVEPGSPNAKQRH